MLHAVSAPLLESFLVGGVMLGAAIGGAAMLTSDTVTLKLHAPVEPGTIYLTAWHDGDVQIRELTPLRPIVFEIRARLDDGCRWLAVETLEPIDETTYSYVYAETMLDCEPGATPRYRATPRQGVVTVEE